MTGFTHSPTTPMPSLKHRRATAASKLRASVLGTTLLRTCQHCETQYKTAGDAGTCERWHEGLLG